MYSIDLNSDIILLGTDRIHLFDTPLLMCRNQGLSMEQRAGDFPGAESCSCQGYR